MPSFTNLKCVDFFTGFPEVHRDADLAFRMKDHVSAPLCSWVVYCNQCDSPMANEHFHCSICDNGDYDLCASCVDKGIHCPGVGHWMVKRFVKDGTVVNSTTERIGPKAKVEAESEAEKEMPGAFTEEKKPEVYEAEQPTRTCNCCVKGELPLTLVFKSLLKFFCSFPREGICYLRDL